MIYGDNKVQTGRRLLLPIEAPHSLEVVTTSSMRLSAKPSWAGLGHYRINLIGLYLFHGGLIQLAIQVRAVAQTSFSESGMQRTESIPEWHGIKCISFIGERISIVVEIFSGADGTV